MDWQSSSRRLGDIVPGLRHREGGPDPAEMPSLYAHTIGRRLPASWHDVANLYVGDVLDWPGVGTKKLEAFLADLQDAAPVEDEIRLIDELAPILVRVAKSASVNDIDNMRDALVDALAGEHLGSELASISIPRITPEDWVEQAGEVVSSFEVAERGHPGRAAHPRDSLCLTLAVTPLMTPLMTPAMLSKQLQMLDLKLYVHSLGRGVDQENRPGEWAARLRA